MGFLDTLKGIGSGFLSGGVGGAITGGITARAEDNAQHDINVQNRAVQATHLEQFDNARRQAVEGIRKDQMSLEQDLANRGMTNSEAAQRARLELNRDAESRMLALESARRRWEAGEKMNEVQADLEKATRRAGYIGQGVSQAINLIGGLVTGGAIGGGMSAASGAQAGQTMGSMAAPMFQQALGNTPSTLLSTPTATTKRRYNTGGLGESGLR